MFWCRPLDSILLPLSSALGLSRDVESRSLTSSSSIMAMSSTPVLTASMVASSGSRVLFELGASSSSPFESGSSGIVPVFSTGCGCGSASTEEGVLDPFVEFFPKSQFNKCDKKPIEF